MAVTILTGYNGIFIVTDNFFNSNFTTAFDDDDFSDIPQVLMI